MTDPMTPRLMGEVRALSQRLAAVERSQPSGTGVSTAFGATSVRTTQLGFEAELTGGYDSSTGYPWKRLELDTSVPEVTDPAVQLTGEYAFTVDDNQTLAGGTRCWLEPAPNATGYLIVGSTDAGCCDWCADWYTATSGQPASVPQGFGENFPRPGGATSPGTSRYLRVSIPAGTGRFEVRAGVYAEYVWPINGGWGLLGSPGYEIDFYFTVNVRLVVKNAADPDTAFYPASAWAVACRGQMKTKLLVTPGVSPMSGDVVGLFAGITGGQGVFWGGAASLCRVLPQKSYEQQVGVQLAFQPSGGYVELSRWGGGTPGVPDPWAGIQQIGTGPSYLIREEVCCAAECAPVPVTVPPPPRPQPDPDPGPGREPPKEEPPPERDPPDESISLYPGPGLGPTVPRSDEA